MTQFKLPIYFVRFDPPDWGPVGEIVYKRTYEHKGEGWGFTVKRVVETSYTLQQRHCKKEGRPWDDDKALQSAIEMYNLIYDMKFLPPGRGLDCGRMDLVDKKGAAVLNNCGFVSTKDDVVDALCWAMDMLALGVGVGFDTLGAGQKIADSTYRHKFDYAVDDTREGWVGALEALLNCYLGYGPYPLFDYSRIRAEGEPLKTMGGVSSGPKPLKLMLDSIDELLNSREGRRLTEENIADLFMLIGRCIVSGNKRRSAELGLGKTSAYMEMKSPDFSNHSFRWAANLSYSAEAGEDLSHVAQKITEGNELGVFWLDNAQKYSRMGRPADNKDYRVAGTNPCSEQSLEHKELCCLVEIFPSRHESYYELQKTLKYAYLYAKSITLGETHDQKTNNIIKRNRRIGCSMSGIVPAAEKHGYHSFVNEWLPRGYDYIQALDDRYSEWLAIPRSIKTTSVKPSGTVSKLPGVAPGIHWPHSEYYYQVIRFNEHSPYLPALRDAGYDCVDISAIEPNTVAVYFPVKEDDFSRCKDDVSMWEQLELIAQVQHQWSDNQVSATVTFSEGERVDIPAALEKYASRLKSATFFPREVTRFKHAPMQAINREAYEKALDRLKPLVLPSVKEMADKHCDGDSCEI